MGFLVRSLIFLAPTILLPRQAGFLELHLIFDCGFQHLFPSVTDWCLSHDYLVVTTLYKYSRKLLGINILTFLFSPIMFGSVLGLSLVHSAPGSWHSRQSQGWAPSCGMGVSLNQSLVSHSQSLYHPYPSYLHIPQTGQRSKVVWLGLCPNPSTGSLVWSQGLASSSYISTIARSLSSGHPSRYLGVSGAPGFYLTPKCPHFRSSLSVFSPSIYSSCSHPHTPPVHPQISF